MGLLGGIGIPLMLGAVWLVVAVRPPFIRMAGQMGFLWSCYDSAVMMVNIVVFNMGCSLFVTELYGRLGKSKKEREGRGKFI